MDRCIRRITQNGQINKLKIYYSSGRIIHPYVSTRNSMEHVIIIAGIQKGLSAMAMCTKYIQIGSIQD